MAERSLSSNRQTEHSEQSDHVGTVETPTTTPIPEMLDEMGTKGSYGITIASEKTMAQTAFRYIGDESVSGKWYGKGWRGDGEFLTRNSRALAVMPKGLFEIGDRVDGDDRGYGGHGGEELCG